MSISADSAGCPVVAVLSVFTVLLPSLLGDFIQKVLIGYGELLMARKKKPFSCDRCGNDEQLIWKTRHGKPTKILTTFTWITLRQLQVQCSCCGHKFSITRMLLGLDPYQRIAPEIRRKLGLLGSLTNNFIYSKGNVYKTKDRLSMDIGWLKFPGTKDGAVFDLQKLGVPGSKNELKKALTSPPRKALEAEFWGEDGKTSRMIDGVAFLVSLMLSWALIAGLRSSRGEYRYSKNNQLTER